ncbi:MAG: hypothetical protein ACPHF4_01455, partial [Rubripirellula sp.]
MMLVVGLLPVLGDFSVGRAEENDAAVEQSPLYVFRFIEVAPENVANWRQAVKDKQLKFNTGKDSAQWGTWRILTGPRERVSDHKGSIHKSDSSRSGNRGFVGNARGESLVGAHFTAAGKFGEPANLASHRGPVLSRNH